MHVLLAEDDMKLGKLIKYMQEQNGISTEWVTTVDMIYDYAMYEDYDVLVLDWMMPKMSGVDACKKLRSEGYQRAILLLTARDSVEDRVTGLDAGADDYLVKPFDVVELLARVEVVLRRFHKMGAQLSAGDVVVDMDARMVTKAGMPVVLTNKEYGLLVLFIQNKNIALFKENLYEKVWGEEYDGDSRTLELHVQRLRKKMGWERQLVAVYKVGYRLEIA